MEPDRRSESLSHVDEGNAPFATVFSSHISGSIGERIEINGTDLIPPTAVEFNSVSALFTSMAGLPLLAQLPEGATTGPITVRTSNWSFTTTEHFTVIIPPQPVLFGFTPSSGAPGDRIVLKGTNIARATAVEFNGVNAWFSNIIAPDLLTTVPDGAVTGPIIVRTPGGIATSVESFTVLPRAVIGPPIVYSFSPSEGTPGTHVIFNGTNFYGLVSISFGGGETQTSGIVTNVGARVPTNAVTGPITVTTANGSFTTREVFTVLPPPPPPPPVVSYFTPLAGEVGSIMTIRGAYLDRVTEVRLNGSAVDFRVNPPGSMWEHISVVIPPHATTGPITVISPEGSATHSRLFTVVQRPVITGFVPETGSPGTVIRLVGTNLESIVSLRMGAVPVEYDQALRTFKVPLDAESGPLTMVFAYRESDGLPQYATQRGVVYHAAWVTAGTPDPDIRDNRSLSAVRVGDGTELEIRSLSGSQLEVRWTALDGGWSLECADQIAGSEWQTADSSVLEASGWRVLREQATSTSKFYRLKPTPPR
jgi:hypothetical protein